jgi:hypothetical protein
MHVSIKELPSSLQSVLSQLGYHKKDISIEAKESVSVYDAGGAGRRGFYALVALDGSLAPEIHHGSWGGANMFVTTRVDSDDSMHKMLPGIAVITGSSGEKTFAYIALHPDNIVALLPGKLEVTARQKEILSSIRGLKPSYRPKYPEAEIDELVKLGLLKRNKIGSISITTEGKNAS